MIRSGLARWHTMTAAGRDLAALELSKWWRGTIIAMIGFGSFLMLLGGLFTWGLAKAAYEQLERGGFFIGSESDYSSIVGFWVIVLLLLYGGDFIRAAGWRELRRRRPGAVTATSASAGATIVGILLAPVLLFWGASGVASFIRTWQMLMSRPAWNRPSWALIVQNRDVWIWWLLTLAWLAGGVFLIWRGIHVLSRRSASGS